MFDLTWQQWALGIVGAFLMGMAKGGLPGVGNISPLLFASAFAARESVGLLLPVLVAGDICGVILYRRHTEWKYVWRLLPWMLLGVVLGWMMFDYLSDRAVKIFIAVTIFGMTLFQIVRWWLQRKGRDPLEKVPNSRWFSATLGTSGGIATMIANAAGPIGQIYFLSVDLPKMAFIGTAAWTFFIVNLSKVPLQVELGIITLDSIGLSLVFCIFCVVGALLAPLIVKRIKQETFQRLIWLFVIVAALKLLWD
ncbi:MAG: sulfite exporter TauE/SafE family protein [Verrucomicrobiota bacterium JB022]|nr:sulfite exporter TauE/SafE family protein [Verrucomicrobiota bacterium JB022]